jgi:hypothetical protein
LRLATSRFRIFRMRSHGIGQCLAPHGCGAVLMTL